MSDDEDLQVGEVEGAVGEHEPGPLVVAVSSRALFDLKEANSVFEEKGLVAYRKYQEAHEDDLLEPGAGFPLIKALLDFDKDYPDHLGIRVVVMSRNSPEAGLRIQKSLEHHEVPIRSAVFSRGEALWKYLDAFKTDLFLSMDPNDVQAAIDAGFAGALIYDAPQDSSPDPESLRIAFDADAVIFSEESERVYKEGGLDAFLEHERANAKRPLPEGPFARLFKKLSLVQPEPDSNNPPIRIVIVTSRDFAVQERVVRTLRAWGTPIDQIFYMGGLDKAPLLKAIRPHIFFDDQEHHVKSAAAVASSARVPYKPGADPNIPLAAPEEAQETGGEEES